MRDMHGGTIQLHEWARIRTTDYPGEDPICPVHGAVKARFAEHYPAPCGCIWSYWDGHLCALPRGGFQMEYAQLEHRHHWLRNTETPTSVCAFCKRVVQLREEPDDYCPGGRQV